jgi:PAS domain S-box-containing protein
MAQPKPDGKGGSIVDAQAEPLRWADERLRLATEAARLGLWEWDVVSGVVSWSAGLEAIHGIATGTFPGTFEAWKADIHPDDRDRVVAAVAAGLEERSGHNLEYRIIRPDNGAVRWLEVHSRVQCDDQQRPMRMLGVCMDVTERKQVEEARELFIGILGHDLKNPLQTIQTAATLMLRDEVASPGMLKAAGLVSRSAARMDQIIRDLLDFARGRFGQGIPVTRQWMSMEVVWRQVIDELVIAHPEANLSLHVHGEVEGEWDPARVAQVASNLIENAIVHGDGSARVVLRRVEDHVVVTVANDGEPIPAATIPFLFQPFYSRSTSRENLGLGLFIVSEIVKAHCGQIDVSSSSKGTMFTVYWPAEALNAGA